MAFEIPGLDLPCSVSANAASGIGQYCFVKLDTAGGSFGRDCIPAASNTDVVIGVNQDAGDTTTTLNGAAVVASAGQSINVRQTGVSKVQIASAVNRGDRLVISGTAGQVATAPALGATNVRLVGIALEGATNAGDLISVLLTPGAVDIVNV